MAGIGEILALIYGELYVDTGRENRKHPQQWHFVERREPNTDAQGDCQHRTGSLTAFPILFSLKADSVSDVHVSVSIQPNSFPL